MSFLQNLQNKKSSLKPTETLVTLTTGRRYIEHSSETFPPSFGFVVDNSPDETPAQIIHNLYLGAQDCCASTMKFDIKSVLSVGIEPPHKFPSVEYFFVESLDLPETDLRPIILRCNEIIMKCMESGNILVHCNAGVSRSSAVIIGYLILERQLNYEDAFRLVKNARPSIQPNNGFVKQLKNL